MIQVSLYYTPKKPTPTIKKPILDWKIDLKIRQLTEKIENNSYLLTEIKPHKKFTKKQHSNLNVVAKVLREKTKQKNIKL
jgi:hypothetical protein